MTRATNRQIKVEEDQNLEEVTTNGNITSKNIIIDALGSTSRLFDEELTVRKNVSQNSGNYSSLLADTKVVNTENGNGEYYALASRSQIESDFDFGFLFGSLNYANVVSASTANGNVVYGNRSSAEMRGSGDLNFLIGVSSAATSRELGASNITYIRGVSSTAALLNAEKSADYLQGTHISVNLAAGTVNDDISINYLDFDYTAGTVNGDFAYITTKDTAIDFSFVNGTARFIDSLVPLPSRFGGSIESTELIVTGKTSDDVLLGDGTTTSLAGIIGGGIQSVVAGTNVTVDNTDPNNPIVNASSSGGGYQNITESIDVNNDFDITIGDTNTAAIKVQNQNSFNYIEIGALGLASRVDVPSTDIRLGDQFGFVNGVNMLIGGTQIELNTSNGFVLSTNFGTEKVTLKNDLLSSNVQYDVNFPDKANGSSETFAMLSDINIIGFIARDSSNTIPAGSPTDLNFSTTDYQDASDWDGNVYTVPVDGIYECMGHGTFTSVTSGNASMTYVTVNNSFALGGILGRSRSGSTGQTGDGGSIRLVCSEGDKIRMMAYCENSTTMAQPGANDPGYTTFSILKK